MVDPRQIRILGIPDLGRSPLTPDDVPPATAIQKWSESKSSLAQAAVSADSAWDGFFKSRFVHQSDKRHHKDLCEAAKKECKLLVMCGKRESGAAAATVSF